MICKLSNSFGKLLQSPTVLQSPTKSWREKKGGDAKVATAKPPDQVTPPWHCTSNCESFSCCSVKTSLLDGSKVCWFSLEGLISAQPHSLLNFLFAAWNMNISTKQIISYQYWNARYTFLQADPACFCSFRNSQPSADRSQNLLHIPKINDIAIVLQALCTDLGGHRVVVTMHWLPKTIKGYEVRSRKF